MRHPDMIPRPFLLLTWFGWLGTMAVAAPNYDESKVGTYTLPDPLVFSGGGRVASAGEWSARRRPELFELFQREIYGRAPGRLGEQRYQVGRVDPRALGGLATRKQISIWLEGRPEGARIELMVYLPNAVQGPVPVFLGLNYYGNQSVEADPEISMSTRWMRPTVEMGIEKNRATEASRGRQSSRWPLALILERGYAVATFYYGDVEPDHRDGWQEGVRGVWSRRSGRAPGKEDWGALAAWAWGLSRALDYLETDPAVDARRVAVLGHSRHGKAALWAGAVDDRFALVISNDSGEGGASLARRQFGERVEDLVRAVPYWFCGNYARYVDREAELPVDAHQLLALTAPRPVYVASATEDLWADPRGEFLAAYHASPVWALWGRKGLSESEPPPLDQSVGDFVGYHVRSGDHDLTAQDWREFLRFADRHGLSRSRSRTR